MKHTGFRLRTNWEQFFRKPEGKSRRPDSTVPQSKLPKNPERRIHNIPSTILFKMQTGALLVGPVYCMRHHEYHLFKTENDLVSVSVSVIINRALTALVFVDTQQNPQVKKRTRNKRGFLVKKTYKRRKIWNARTLLIGPLSHVAYCLQSSIGKLDA